jgi:hypothetical protein
MGSNHMEVTMRFQIRTRNDGDYEVVDVHTGQVRECGSIHMARFIQATLLKVEERKERSR